MDNKSLFIAEKVSRIEELTKDFSISKYNLLKISFLIRLIEESENHSSSCAECEANMGVLVGLIEEIPLLDDIEHRKPYENEFNRIRKHFHQKHGFIPPYYYTSRWSLFGGLIGLVFAIVISFIAVGVISKDGVLAGITLGVIVGYLFSSFKELKFRKTKKII